MGNIINPATGKPFKEGRPSAEVQDLRYQILRVLRSRYDAAQTTAQNSQHWKWADSLSPNSANSRGVRKTLRERSRYEMANNGYLKGIALTLINDFTGSGPTLQITDDHFTDEQRRFIEQSFARYACKIKLRQLIWQLRFAKMETGEGFGFGIIDEMLPGPIKYSYRVIEADQVSGLNTPVLKTTNRYEIDGVRFSKTSGRPTHYYLLNQHPGEGEITALDPVDGQWINVRHVIHWFRKDRPWQRGIPETAPSLPLWALLRRYTLAVVQNAEIAADYTVLLKSLQGAAINPWSGDASGSDTDSWFDSFPVDRGLMTVLPSGYDLTQLDPKQPVTVYDSFVDALIQEAARPLLCPRNHALGNSGGYNMASGALDKQVYREAINQERLHCSEDVLDDRILFNWWFEAVRTPGYFDADLVRGTGIHEVIGNYQAVREEPPEHVWRWDDVPEHTDPVKVASALDILHKGGHISDIDIQEGRFNRSVEKHYKNLEAQNAWRSKNMPLPFQETREQQTDAARNADMADNFDENS